MKFTKMHGCGNDFILVNNFEEKIDLKKRKKLATFICNRRVNVGADGIIFMTPSKLADCDIRMEFYNADGSLAEMCGNGARCLARFAHEQLNLKDMHIETLSGIISANHVADDIYKIEIKTPSVEKYEVSPKFNNKIIGDYFELGDPGIPHFVYNIDFSNISKDKLFNLGKNIREDNLFSKGTNVNFYYKEEDHLNVLTYERGVENFTLACGTGVSSVAISYLKEIENGQNNIKMNVPGGNLLVEVVKEEGKYKKIMLSGKTKMVYYGTYLGG